MWKRVVVETLVGEFLGEPVGTPRRAPVLCSGRAMPAVCGVQAGEGWSLLAVGVGEGGGMLSPSSASLWSSSGSPSLWPFPLRSLSLPLAERR